MRTINIHEAKTHLSRLVEQVAAGEPFIIAKAGKPLVNLVRIPKSSGKKVLGSAKNDAGLVLKQRWDAPLTDREMVEWFGL